MRTVMIGDKRYHLPHLDLIPMSAADDAALGRSIEEYGGAFDPIFASKGKSKGANVWVVDGAHRVIHLERLKLDPPKVIFRAFEDDEEELEFARDANFDRRQMSAGEVERERRARIDRVAERRKQGESLRAIAEAEGVSKTQIDRDLTESTVPPGTVVTVTGLDGKKRPAKPVLCKRCTRIGKETKNCKECERIRKRKAAKRTAKSKAKSKAKEAVEQKVDCFKTPVPQHLCPVLFDPWVQDSIDLLAEVSERFRLAWLIDGMAKRKGKMPWTDAKDFADGCGFVIQYLDQLIDHLKTTRLEAVCPLCKGEKCGGCRMAGLVPRSVHAELTGAKP